MYNAAANRRHYLKHRDRRAAENKARTKAVQAWLVAYRSEHPCIECGEADECCLDFHHRNPAEKIIEVTRAVRAGWSAARILTEIAKCDVLCANCHRRLHRRARGIVGNTRPLHG